MAPQFKRTKISAANLERGMYVAQLDRPWLETPFPSRGFEIREDSELALLRKFCKHVYIDMARSSLPREKLLQAVRKKEFDELLMQRLDTPQQEPHALARRVMRLVAKLDPTGTLMAQVSGHRTYRNTVPVRKEAPQSIRAYDGALVTMQDVMDCVRRGATPDVGKVQGAVKPLIDSVLRNHDAMAWLVYQRKRDEDGYNRSIASSVWAVILGRHLGFDRQSLDTLAMGGILLDIGKAKLPESIVANPGKLSEDEYNNIKRHVALGLKMIRLTPGINADVLAMIEGHHERHDGSGYPRGLKGSEIPVFARIGGLVDCYDAMISHRPGTRGKSPYDAICEINGMADTKFQKELVEQFVQALGMFPTGGLVEMNTGEIGMVVEQNPIRRLRPKVMLVLDSGKQPLSEYRMLDLRKCPSDQNDPSAFWIVRGHEPGAFGLDPKSYFIA